MEPEKKILLSHNNNKAKTMLISQNRERIFRAAREKGQVTYKGRPVRITQDFSTEIMKTRRAWSEAGRKMQTLREHKCQSRLLYQAKLSINIDELPFKLSLVPCLLVSIKSEVFI